MPLDLFSRTHDPISYISPERAQAGMNLPVPVGMFMNMAHIPPRFYNQHQQALQARQQQNPRNRKVCTKTVLKNSYFHNRFFFYTKSRNCITKMKTCILYE